MPEMFLEFAIQHRGPGLQQIMSPLVRPLHLLFFDHPPGDDFVDRGFNKGGRNGFAMTPFLTIVRDHRGVVADIGVELFERSDQFLSIGVPKLRRIALPATIIEALQRLFDVPMPEKPLCAFQPISHSPP